MSSNPNEKFEQLLGRELSDRQKQELLRIGKVLEIADNDALWAMLVMHYTFEGRYEQILERIETTGKSQRDLLKSAGKVAATQAQADINQAVKSLVPTVSVEVANAAKLAVRRIGISQSWLSMWMGALIVSVIFILGVAMGSRIYYLFLENDKFLGLYWERASWAFYVGLSCPVFAALGFYCLESDTDEVRFGGWVTIALALLVFILPSLKVMGFIK
jgi:hypothetical protein